MKQILIFSLILLVVAGCGQTGTVVESTPKFTPELRTPTMTQSFTNDSWLAAYAFPASIEPSQKYLFYLHGEIIEDQGLNAVSPDYGKYEYEAILEKLAGYGFVVISEQREKNTDGMKYANRVAGQVTELLTAGVLPENITVIGASKGAGITLAISSLLKNEGANFVVMGTCAPETVESLKQNNMFLYGNVLAIRDSADEFSGSCQELFAFPGGKGLVRYEEIVLNVGTGHGVLYKPLDEWTVPAVEWTKGNTANSAPVDSPALANIPTARPINSADYQGWWTYTHPVYNFSIMLPEDWIVDETTTGDPLMNGHTLMLHTRRYRGEGTEGLQIRVTFRRVGEDVLLWPTGVGAGQFIQQGTLDVAGESARRKLFICPAGQVQEIWYQGASQDEVNIRRGDMEFGFILSLTGFYCEDGHNLNGKIQYMGEMVIASLNVP